MTSPSLDVPSLLSGRGYRPEAIETILREKLLSPRLVRRLHQRYPQHSALVARRPPWFTEKPAYGGLSGYREVCSILADEGIDIGHHAARELFIDVYRFLATRHTLNSIDWDAYETDPIFQLVFPQPGMIRPAAVEAYARAGSREEQRKIAADYRLTTNPHDGKQLLNKPWFTNEVGETEVLDGSQHKYPPVQLVFDSTTQSCFSYCTYCFRHAQVRKDEDMFLQNDPAQVHAYLRAHPEVDDLLITGGDAGRMPAARFADYVTPLIEDERLAHVKAVRLGSRALTYEPESILSPEYDGMLTQFDRLYDEGIQVAYMAHFSTPREVLHPMTLAAIRRLQAHHVVIRSQSPIMKHVSLFTDEAGGIDVERSAQSWIDLGHILGMLCIGFHSMYFARPTGEQHYFAAPIADVQKVFDRIYRRLPSIARPSRPISMTISAGKVTVIGTTFVDGDRLFALKFSEARNMEWIDRVFLAKYDEATTNVSLLEPYDTESFFYEEELAQIEATLAEALSALHRAPARAPE